VELLSEEKPTANMPFRMDCPYGVSAHHHQFFFIIIFMLFSIPII